MARGSQVFVGCGKALAASSCADGHAKGPSFDALYDTVETRTEEAGNVAIFSRAQNYDAAIDAALDEKMPASHAVAVSTPMAVIEAVGERLGVKCEDIGSWTLGVQ